MKISEIFPAEPCIRTCVRIAWVHGGRQTSWRARSAGSGPWPVRLAEGEQLVGVRHLAGESLGVADLAGAGGGGESAGEPDLFADTAAEPGLTDPAFALLGALGGVEVGDLGRPRGRGGGLDLVQHRDPVDPLRDQTCADPYCDAPIRHLDHVTP